MEKQEKNFDIVTSNPDFKKMDVETILEESKTIEPKKVASEVMEWVVNNVENFIDSDVKTFKLDLVLDSEEDMQETRKLQDLYRAIPDDDLDASDKEAINVCQKCRRELDEVTENAFKEIKDSGEYLENLFKRMVYFYEKIIPDPDNKRRALEIDAELKALIEEREEIEDVEVKENLQKQIVAKIDEGEKLVNFSELEGAADVLRFEYEAFNVGVRLRSGAYDEKGEDIPDEDKETMKEYTIPEGFTVWVQLVYRTKQRPTTIF